MCTLTAKPEQHISVVLSSVDVLPDRVTDDLDLYSLKAIEKYLDKRKGAQILKPKRDLKAENAELNKEAARLREELRSFTEGEGC